MKQKALILFLCFVGCKTVEPIVVHDTHDSVRVVVKTDRVVTYQHDSVFVMVKGDTVWLEKWRTMYRDSIVQVHDTTTLVQQQTKVVEVERERSGFETFCLWFFWVCVVVFVLLLVYKVLKSFLNSKFSNI